MRIPPSRTTCTWWPIHDVIRIETYWNFRSFGSDPETWWPIHDVIRIETQARKLGFVIIRNLMTYPWCNKDWNLTSLPAGHSLIFLMTYPWCNKDWNISDFLGDIARSFLMTYPWCNKDWNKFTPITWFTGTFLMTYPWCNKDWNQNRLQIRWWS